MTRSATLTLLPLVLACGSAVGADARETAEPPASAWTWRPSLSWQYDQVAANGDTSSHHHGFRRQRIALEVAHSAGAAVKLDYDFSSGRWADALVRVRAGRVGEFRVGQFKPPMSLEMLTSHRALSWLERSPAAALVPGRRLGVEWQTGDDQRQSALAVTGRDLDRQANTRALTARHAGNWMLESHRLHLGLSLAREWPRAPVRLRPLPAVSGFPVSWLPSPLVANIDRQDRLGIELAWDHGPMHLQGEWLALNGQGPSASVSARGHYLSLGWRPGGQTRRFKRGLPERLQADREWGSLELVARIGRIDIDPGSAPSRHGRTATIGVNWIIDPRWSLHGQLATARAQPGADFDAVHAFRLHLQF